MGLMSVYNFANISNWHLPFRFKATFNGDMGGDDIYSFSVKSITKPRFSLGTDSINQYYGTTRFVMPTIEFDKATMDITFVDQEDGKLQDYLFMSLGSASTNGPTSRVNVRIDEYDISMTKLISSRVYDCMLKSIDLPDYSRTGGTSIVTITGHYVVYSIKNVALEIGDMRAPSSEATSAKLADATAKQDNGPNSANSPLKDVTPPPPPKPPVRLNGDDPAVVEANKKKDTAIARTDNALDLLYGTMHDKATGETIGALDDAGFAAYKSDHNKNAMPDDAIDEAGRRAEWDNMSDADKMRYILLSQGIDITDGISDDASSKDENGKTEAERLLDTLALINDSDSIQGDEAIAENQKQLATAAAILGQISDEEKAAREGVDKAIKDVNKKIEEEKANYAKELAEYNEKYGENATGGTSGPAPAAGSEGGKSDPAKTVPPVTSVGGGTTPRRMSDEEFAEIEAKIAANRKQNTVKKNGKTVAKKMKDRAVLEMSTDDYMAYKYTKEQKIKEEIEASLGGKDENSQFKKVIGDNGAVYYVVKSDNSGDTSKFNRKSKADGPIDDMMLHTTGSLANSAKSAVKQMVEGGESMYLFGDFALVREESIKNGRVSSAARARDRYADESSIAKNSGYSDNIDVGASNQIFGIERNSNSGLFGGKNDGVLHFADSSCIKLTGDWQNDFKKYGMDVDKTADGSDKAYSLGFADSEVKVMAAVFKDMNDAGTGNFNFDNSTVLYADNVKDVKSSDTRITKDTLKGKTVITAHDYVAQTNGYEYGDKNKRNGKTAEQSKPGLIRLSQGLANEFQQMKK